MSGKDETVRLRLSAVDAARWKAAAEARGVSLSALIANAVELHLLDLGERDLVEIEHFIRAMRAKAPTEVPGTQRRRGAPNPDRGRLSGPTDQDREIVRLTGEGLSHREVADRLNLSTTRVSQLRKRALARWPEAFTPAPAAPAPSTPRPPRSRRR